MMRSMRMMKTSPDCKMAQHVDEASVAKWGRYINKYDSMD
jgi:hypothetical protein